MRRRVEVAVRVRPGEGGSICVALDKSVGSVAVRDETGLHASGSTLSYKEDLLLDEHMSNKEVYEVLVRNNMQSATSAHPDTLCILAYGHTNSGKTHSIAGSEEEPGLLTLCVEELLEREGVVEVTMVEVYMETVHDLLSDGEERRVRRRQGPSGPLILIEDLTSCAVTSMAEWMLVSRYGMRSRRTAATDRNARSSRSHAIFTIKSYGVRLCLVDLAGSERQSIFSPQLNKESISINKSLSRLSTVLEALSGQRKRQDGTVSFVNFRDTTLTVLLQRYLCGASMTTFLACIHPDSPFFPETVSTLRYTQRLKYIKTSVSRPGVDDISISPTVDSQKLIGELALLRKVINDTYNRSHTTQTEEQNRVDELQHTILQQQQDRSPSPSETMGDTVGRFTEGLLPTVSMLRAKDTRRVAGWLLRRILSHLPQLNVGFDEYFDSFLPPEVQMIGYVSTMAHLVSRDTDDDRLAFLDVGDIAMGLSMLDAGIPPFVRLHRGTCPSYRGWEAYEYAEMEQGVYVLAFFEVTDHTMQEMEGPDSFSECCGGFLSSEPIYPIATVLCVCREASAAVKESLLQHLISIQGETVEGLDPSTRNAPTSLSSEASDQEGGECCCSFGGSVITAQEGMVHFSHCNPVDIVSSCSSARHLESCGPVVGHTQHMGCRNGILLATDDSPACDAVTTSINKYRDIDKKKEQMVSTPPVWIEEICLDTEAPENQSGQHDLGVTDTYGKYKSRPALRRKHNRRLNGDKLVHSTACQGCAMV